MVGVMPFQVLLIFRVLLVIHGYDAEFHSVAGMSMR